MNLSPSRLPTIGPHIARCSIIFFLPDEKLFKLLALPSELKTIKFHGIYKPAEMAFLGKSTAAKPKYWWM